MIKNKSEKYLLPQNGNILYILNVLKKYSDYEHILSVKDIIEKVEEEYDVKLEERTIRRNINLLIEKLGYDISTWNDNRKGYYLVKDPEIDFEIGELRTIIDTFSYATFIDTKLSKEIINKCKNYQNIYENEKLKDYRVYSDNIKTENKEVIKNIEDISNAIYEKKQITFDYYKYAFNPNLQLEKENSYRVSPYAIVYSIQELYLICLYKEKLYTFRIDRMKNINILDEKVSTRIKDNDIEKYISSTISMYGGVGEDIEAICDMSLINNVIDVFGKNTKVKKLDDKHFMLYINKDLESFKRYVLRNLDLIRVVKPDKLKKSIDTIIKNYLK